MWAGPHTDLLSGKSMFIDMHDIDSADESTLCFTVQWHEYIRVLELSQHFMSKYNTRIILFVVLCVKTLQVCNLPKTKILKFTQTKILVLY